MNKRPSTLAWCSLVAIAMVVFRSFPFLFYEHLDFDSDQAIIGLMAKHLSDCAPFPSFSTASTTCSGVQAWIAAPFVSLGGPRWRCCGCRS